MRHEEKYCIWSGISKGGFPLEEASEQERIPSIIGSIVWCCPTSRVLIITKCGFFYIALWIYCVFSICGDYICRSIQVLNKWYQSTLLGQTLWTYIFYFCRFFFPEKKKEGHDILEVFGIFLCNFF
jgi:hypothetical protein